MDLSKTKAHLAGRHDKCSWRVSDTLVSYGGNHSRSSSNTPAAVPVEPRQTVHVPEGVRAPAIDVAAIESSSAPDPPTQPPSASALSVEPVTAREPTAAPTERVEGRTASRAALYYQSRALHSTCHPSHRTWSCSADYMRCPSQAT
jgi:hypothetical protein